MAVISGLESLLAAMPPDLRGARAGLISNPTGVTRFLEWNVTALRAAGVNLVSLFSPEHGFFAAAGGGEHVGSSIEPRTGLPVYSLYGETRKPTAEMLAGVDLLLFDLQDVGARFYTYTATLAFALEACAEHRRRLIVLDRPNPIGGVRIEGPVLDLKLQTFVGRGPLPIRYALTIGELARFYNDILEIHADLTVVPLRGWTREMDFCDTGLPWVSPSPNIPHWTTTLLYPGTCLIEGTNLSAGRGTPLPFEICGAPWMDGGRAADAFNALALEGMRARPLSFTPTASTYANEACSGVQLHLFDRAAGQPVRAALHLLQIVHRLHPDRWAWRESHFDRLIGVQGVRERIERGDDIAQMVREWEPAQAAFESRAQAARLYS